jgi:hypothetical protein
MGWLVIRNAERVFDLNQQDLAKAILERVMNLGAVIDWRDRRDWVGFVPKLAPLLPPPA